MAKVKVRISVDFAVCQGCATCQALCPELFEVREDGKAWPKEIVEVEESELENLLSRIKEAASTCPLRMHNI
ncbi:MAG: ferredoxin [Thermoproteota archaeon]|uniref:Ferredoxin n=1 Tax=Candidatus Methanodesulfokora washburnensis TaxID=2478471 RepID=A0A520KJD8_9CREN|nr:MAG: ferredoxin [Candidatus Methanodesulfokores washburnensis]TDA41347.1 MAG: ferredoxin [Candidatus Korarchaeota archaeon]